MTADLELIAKIRAALERGDITFTQFAEVLLRAAEPSAEFKAMVKAAFARCAQRSKDDDG